MNAETDRYEYRTELDEIFNSWDPSGNGTITKGEFRLSVRALGLEASSADCDALFDQYDEDKGGTVDKKEFHRAIRSLGFDVTKEDTDLVFDSLDVDNSGALEYAELNEMLRKGVGADGTKARLKRMQGKQRDTSRGGKLTAKNVNNNYIVSRAAALSPMVQLDAASGKSIQEQLHDIQVAICCGEM